MLRKGNEMRLKSDKLIIILYLAGFLAMALTIALMQPLADTPPLFANPPDEHARYLIPRYICRYGKIPTGFEEEVRIPTYGFSYGLYNVFPYIVQGYLMRFVSLFTRSEAALLYTARLVNVFSGLAMAVMVYLTARMLFTDRRYGWLFCFAVMYLPQNLFLHTYVNTDSMCMLAVAMMVYALVRGYRQGFSRGCCLWLSGGIILCALSYYNAYGYILSSIFLFLAYFIRKKNGRLSCEWKEMLKKGSFISVVVLLGISWWFIRSYILYDGDILGLKTRERMAGIYAEDIVNPLSGNTYKQQGYTILEMMKEKNFAECVFYSFVAAFGSVSIVGNIWLYRFYKVFFAAGLMSFCLIRRKMSPEEKGHRGIRAFFHLNMLFCIAMPVILLIHYAYTMDYQDQGRYILPALIPFMYYVTEGLRRLVNLKRVPGVAGNIVTAFVLLGILAGTIWMVYGNAVPVYLQTGLVLR